MLAIIEIFSRECKREVGGQGGSRNLAVAGWLKRTSSLMRALKSYNDDHTHPAESQDTWLNIG